MNEIQKKLLAWMLFSRYFEELTEEYWDRGAISGEMHLGIGEEAICAGIIAHLGEGDSLALDHRGTAPMLMRNVDPLRVMLEIVGHADGLCRGRGGHMHLFSREALIGSSGIVGASGPLALGFALASTNLRPGKIAVGFFGEGAVNQGMLMESFNLAVAWNLPVLFVCKDNGWAITTRSETVTGGDLEGRARAFGLNTIDADGSDVMDVYSKSQMLISWIRGGKGPGFVHASCVHPKGHFLGDSLVKIKEKPVAGLLGSSRDLAGGVISSGGGSIGDRLHAVKSVLDTMSTSRKDLKFEDRDPIAVFRKNFMEFKAEMESIDQGTRTRIERLKTAVDAKLAVDAKTQEGREKR
jgi:acetoin:2,6-dichlorophenolindophenol oxidoreductase subunit alpha